jgi:hypothetical protein
VSLQLLVELYKDLSNSSCTMNMMSSIFHDCCFPLRMPPIGIFFLYILPINISSMYQIICGMIIVGLWDAVIYPQERSIRGGFVK